MMAVLAPSAVLTVALAATTLPGVAWQSGARGYWFYQSPPQVPRYIKMPAPPVSPATAMLEKKNPCRSQSTWTAGCGFVTPRSFAFQAHERDALMQAMVMHPDNQRAVKAVQKYTRWVVDQALSATRMWQYNMVQDPGLSGTATAPISTYGLNLAFSVHVLNRKAAWAAVKRFQGVLILFTKRNCSYCNAEVPLIKYMERDTGLKVWQASLQGPCDKAFRARCVLPKDSMLPARILHVSIVPTLFIYLPGDIWIRVSAGLTTVQTMEDNLYNFFVAWREAAIRKLKATGSNPAMDFSPKNRPSPEAMQEFLSRQIPSGRKNQHGPAGAKTGGSEQ